MHLGATVMAMDQAEPQLVTAQVEAKRVLCTLPLTLNSQQTKVAGDLSQAYLVAFSGTNHCPASLRRLPSLDEQRPMALVKVVMEHSCGHNCPG